jgi:hypothetical protein
MNLLFLYKDSLFLQKLALLFALENSPPELSFPLFASCIHEESSAMKEVVLPLALVDGAIWELIDSLSMMFTILPLSFVD